MNESIFLTTCKWGFQNLLSLTSSFMRLKLMQVYSIHYVECGTAGHFLTRGNFFRIFQKSSEFFEFAMVIYAVYSIINTTVIKQITICVCECVRRGSCHRYDVNVIQ